MQPDHLVSAHKPLITLPYPEKQPTLRACSGWGGAGVTARAAGAERLLDGAAAEREGAKRGQERVPRVDEAQQPGRLCERLVPLRDARIEAQTCVLAWTNLEALHSTETCVNEIYQIQSKGMAACAITW